MQRLSRRAIAPAVAITLLSAVLSFALTSASASASSSKVTTAPVFHLVQTGPAFDAPVWMGGMKGSTSLIVAELGGKIWKVSGNTKTLFLDLSHAINQSGGEQGLLSVAINTNAQGTGRMWAYFVVPNGNGLVRQYRVNQGAVVNGSGKNIIAFKLSPPNETNHNGGTLIHLPDNTLLLSIGDGGSAGDPFHNGQNMRVLMGKIIRIIPKAAGGYVIPTTNPYVHRRGMRHEIWALGLRNPWRIAFDQPTGDLWIGDVGQDRWEEIDHWTDMRPKGANFGWSRFEGSMVFNSAQHLTAGTPYVGPRIRYIHGNTRCSVTGGPVYRGPYVRLRGWYLYGDFCDDDIIAFNNATSRQFSTRAVGQIVSFGTANNGDVYAVSQSTNHIHKIVAGAATT